MGEIKLGTSGFSFNDWKGVLYPEKSAKSDWFSVYVQYFSTTEINATYYGLPSQKVFTSLDDRAPDNFEFIVKVNQESTHVRKNSTESMRALIDVVEPLVNSGKLSGFLAQFPFSYRNSGDNRRYLLNLKDDCSDIPLFVEFRHVSWNHPAVFDFMQRNEILYCCVDEPQLEGLLPPQDVTTGGMGYVRFHGRNARTWWDSSQGDRYDYLYSDEELSEWIQRIREMNRKTKKTYLFFNNCHAGHAVKGARLMAELIKDTLDMQPLVQDIPE